MINKKKDKYLFTILDKYNQWDTQLKKSTTIANLDLYTTTKRKMKKIEKLALLMRNWEKHQAQLQEWININQTDGALKTMATAEINNLKKQINDLENNIVNEQTLSSNQKLNNTIMEIRGAVGGKEATLFAENIFDMYINFFNNQNWKWEIWEKNECEGEGLSLVVVYIKSKKAYVLLQHEGGVHRVQRIPKTENKGRIHTSTVTVAVLEESNEQDMPLDDKELRIDTFRSSGAGGQHVNTTDSGVRVTHLPSGLSVACQEGRSQHDNKDKAKQLLRSRLAQMKKKAQTKTIENKRNQQIGEGERSEKIRTYNFLQNRVTDHRINFTEKNIQEIMNGKLDKILNELKILNEEDPIEHEE